MARLVYQQEMQAAEIAAYQVTLAILAGLKFSQAVSVRLTRTEQLLDK